MTDLWPLSELVDFGMQRTAEADRRNAVCSTAGRAAYIVVQQIYAGATRISSRIEEHACLVNVWRETATRARCAFVVLQRGSNGWFVAEHMNCATDGDAAWAPSLCGGSSRASGSLPQAEGSNPPPAPSSGNEALT